MSISNVTKVQEAQAVEMVRVMTFIDGFNLYHALNKFDFGLDAADQARFQKYKWLCLKSLVGRFVKPKSEMLVGVEYFTTYPTWDEAKRLRHAAYVSAQICMGVHVTFGEFKKKNVDCRATCKQSFSMNEEKQTDINIATAMLELAGNYDKLILMTADSDQVPALKLIKKLHPQKQLAILPPIGRVAKELTQVCDEHFTMTEQHLIDCQLPNPIPIIRNGMQKSTLHKPASW